ncbi:MAG: GNAT family N-acetyltransferase [Patescibacteria group bacterium]|mgnify:CR=1 FL=1
MNQNINEFTQRKVGLADSRLLFHWKNDPIVRRASFWQNIIRFKDHIEWLKAVLNNPNILIYILERNSIPVGMYRLELIKETATINISVDSKFRGQGVGKKIIGQIILTAKNVGIKKLIAEVKMDNLPSNKLFLAFGFYKVKEDVKNGSPYSRYEFNVK